MPKEKVIHEAADRTQAIAVTSVMLLGTNDRRVWAGFTNVGVNDIFIQLGAAAVLHEGLLVAPNGYFGIDDHQYWAGPVFAIAETAITILSGVEVSEKS